MAAEFTVIPEGKFSLSILIKGKKASKFDVLKDREVVATIDLSTAWCPNAEGPTLDLWELTNALRRSGVIGKESTIVSLSASGLHFFEGSAMTLSLGGNEKSAVAAISELF